VSREFQRRIAFRAGLAGLELPSTLVESLGAYLDLVAVWNRTINLTSLRDPDQAVDRLVIEPAVAAPFIPGDARTLLDIGSGGGSPAIPLKLCLPHLRVRMVESKGRKAAFLREAVRQLSLGETTVEATRYQALLQRPDLLGRMDVVTVRAVRMDPAILSVLQSFLAPRGRLMAFTVTGWTGVLPASLVVAARQPLLAGLGGQLVTLRNATRKGEGSA
jgi:16S rRNA (guanine527-N7)-methyltransferase